MKRAPLFLRAAGLVGLASLIAAANGSVPTADVTAVSVTPARGRAELVIDIQGQVEVSDFVLSAPARVVVDLVGARLTAPIMRYDGVARGGVRNVRYAQFRPDVVRVVVELDSARQYDVHKDSSAVRVAIEGAQPFLAWSSDVTRGTSRLVAAPAPTSVATSESRAPAVAASLPPAAPAAPSAAPAAAPARPLTPVNFSNVAQEQSTQPVISVTFDHSTIQEVVATFAAFSGRSIVLGKDAAGEVTAEIHNQPWDYAFNAVLAGQGLGAVQLPGGIIRVDTKGNLNVSDSLEPMVQRVVRINYARATSLAPSLAGVVSARGKVIPDSVTNSIIVTETQTRAVAIDSFIQSLDVRTPQIAIQARIVSVERTELADLGIQYDLGSSTAFFNNLLARTDPATNAPYASNSVVVGLGGNGVAAIANASAALADGAPALNLVYSTVVGNFALTAFLQALQSVSLADVQAEPAVTVADNRKADIFAGEESPIRQVDVASAATAGGGAAPRATTTFKPTGITLEVTPHVVAGTREVMMLLHAERSQVTASGLSEIGAVFSKQQANTQVLVRDGETVVIGGLTVTEITVGKSGIPFLVDLPVIGALFGFRNNKEVRRDLLILVTPHIVDDLAPAGTSGTTRP